MSDDTTTAPEPRPCTRCKARLSPSPLDGTGRLCDACWRHEPGILEDVFRMPELPERPCARCKAKTIGRLCDPCWKLETLGIASNNFFAAWPEDLRTLRLDGAELLSRLYPGLFGVLGEARVNATLNYVVILGPSGVGKTALAAAMAHEWFERKAQVPCLLVSDALAGGREGKLPADTVNAPLVVLDALGDERELPSSLVGEFLRAREFARGPLWVTTALPPPHLTARYGYAISRRVYQRAGVIDLYKLLGLPYPRLAKSEDRGSAR